MKIKNREEIPVISILILAVICIGCFGAEWIMTKNPLYLDARNSTIAPNREFWFGTDTLGRDLFSDVWYGGRISIFIGVCATAISTFIAILIGTLSAVCPKWVDNAIMRLTEICLSVPTLLVVVFFQAIFGKATIFSMCVVIGLTGWFGIAKVVRTEVRQIQNYDYVTASKCMGAGFFHILRKHLAPNFLPGIMFMVVMNIRSAMMIESTLSFMGMGLPIEVITWGSMLSLSQNAFMTKAWWIILIPGMFLVVFFMCVTNIGDWFRRSANPKESNLM